MSSGFSFLFNIIQLGTSSLMSADKVIYFPKMLQILEFDSNRTVRDDDDDDDDADDEDDDADDDVVSVVMVLIF